MKRKEIKKKYCHKLDKLLSNMDLIQEWKKTLPHLFDEYHSKQLKSGFFYLIVKTTKSEGEDDNRMGYFILCEKKQTLLAFFVRSKRFRSDFGTCDVKLLFEEIVLKNFRLKIASFPSVDSSILSVALDSEYNEEVKIKGYLFFYEKSTKPNVKLAHLEFDFDEFKVAQGNEDEELIKKLLVHDVETYFIRKKSVRPMMERKELYFLLEKGKEKSVDNVFGIALLEEKDVIAPNIWTVGMFVNPKYRKKGVGTFIIQKLINICLENKKLPGAACDAPNVGSRKTLLNAGMIVKGLYLVVKLKTL